MRQLISALAILLFLSGCAAQGGGLKVPKRVTEVCDSSGIAPSFVKYGESHLSAKAVQNIRNKKKWRIKLQADNDYKDAIVTITGKTADANWIAASGKASVSAELFICVPDGLAIDSEYYYSVTVQGVGYIDPRAKVVN